MPKFANPPMKFVESVGTGRLRCGQHPSVPGQLSFGFLQLAMEST